MRPANTSQRPNVTKGRVAPNPTTEGMRDEFLRSLIVAKQTLQNSQPTPGNTGVRGNPNPGYTVQVAQKSAH